MLSRLKNYWNFLKTVFFIDTSKDLKKCDVLLFCHDADRGVEFNGKAYSPLLDSMQEELNKNGFTTQTIAHPWSKLIGDKAFGNVVAINRSYFLALLKSKLFKKDLNTYFFIKKIKKASPGKIISIGCSSALCKAARELGIHHAELLHGIGYAAVPWDWDKKAKEHLPQEILSLDSVSTNTFSLLKKQDIKITQIEHPFLKRFHSNLLELPEDWQINSKKEYKKEILVSLQWGYDKEIGCLEKLREILSNGLIPEELIKVIKLTKDDVLWRFRFHPVQLRDKIKFRKHFDFISSIEKECTNCEWHESSTKPLPIILQRCDGHITMFSMSAYEAAYMGVKTLTLCPTIMPGAIQEYFFKDLVANNYVTKSNPSEQVIFDWVSSVEKTNNLLEF